MSPETEARMRAFAERTRAAIDSGAIKCPDSAECDRHLRDFARHTLDCPLGPALAELYRIETDLQAHARALEAEAAVQREAAPAREPELERRPFCCGFSE